ncbi:hypothetical protein F-VV10_0252 [Faustovirus]|nr:hypothetical protein F-VV10_0252 [Faustovirus]
MESIKETHRNAKRRAPSDASEIYNNKRYKINSQVARNLFRNDDDSVNVSPNSIDLDDLNGLHVG